MFSFRSQSKGGEMPMTGKIRNLAAAGCVALGTLVASSAAHAVFIFSDVSYTANSVTFTIDGDMSGYATPDYADQFSLDFHGDIWGGPVSGTNYTPNGWSASVFDNRGILTTGNLYDDTSTNPYSWTRFNATLAGATAIARTVTVAWSQNWLNTGASNPIINFLWGNGNDSFASPTLLGSIDLNAAPAPNPGPEPSSTAVPEPSMLVLFGSGFVLLGAMRRRKRLGA